MPDVGAAPAGLRGDVLEGQPSIRRGPKGRAEVLGANAARADDLNRDVYCLLGMPIDAIDMPGVLGRVDAAIVARNPFLISTPNLNFLRNSLSDAEFRESLLDSNLCPADGMPIVWIAWLMSLPIKSRVSGSDIFKGLKQRPSGGRRLEVFLFGGDDNVADAAAQTINRSPGMVCVGTLNPGFAPVETMQSQDIFDAINSSGADLLAVSLGAKKGQLWLHRNHARLVIPVRAHLGAVINFEAGTIKRAPILFQTLGLEWMWRIKEEPYLWKRYVADVITLLRLMVTRVVPLAILNRRYQFKSPGEFSLSLSRHPADITIKLAGAATSAHVRPTIDCLQKAILDSTENAVVDLSRCGYIDARFFGLLLMLRKILKSEGRQLTFTAVSPSVRRLFRLNELGFLLSTA